MIARPRSRDHEQHGQEHAAVNARPPNGWDEGVHDHEQHGHQTGGMKVYMTDPRAHLAHLAPGPSTADHTGGRRRRGQPEASQKRRRMHAKGIWRANAAWTKSRARATLHKWC